MGQILFPGRRAGDPGEVTGKVGCRWIVAGLVDDGQLGASYLCGFFPKDVALFARALRSIESAEAGGVGLCYKAPLRAEFEARQRRPGN